MFNKIEKKDKVLSEKAALFLTFLTLIFIVLVAQFVISALLPKVKVQITISAPEKIGAGEWITYKVSCQNLGNVILEKPELFFQFPLESITEKNKFTSESLGEFLYPKEIKTLEFRGRLFGKEGEKKEVKAWLTYKRKRGREIFTSKISSLSTILTEIPVDLVLDVPAKIPVLKNLDSDFSFRLKYNSLLNEQLDNLVVKFNFPSAFSLQEATPPLSKDIENWKINSLAKGENGEIELRGVFQKGKISIGEELMFKAQLFIALEEKEIYLKEVSYKATAFEPFLSFSQKINGKENYVAKAGEKLHYQISFKNIKEEPLRNLKIIVTLDGPFFDLDSIEAPRGDFTPGSNSISWDEEKLPSLRYLIPGNEESIDFWIKLKNDYKPQNLSETNAQIKNKILVSGFEKEYRNKVQTKLIAYQEGYYYDKYGFFQNSGPHPPKVNETTTYTIVWKYENYYNWLEGAKMVASFPANVEIRGMKGNLRIESKKETGVLHQYYGIPINFRFEKPLQEGMSSEEVKYLQIILAKEVPHAWPKNASPTGYFGKATVEAVNAFQLKYRDQILTPQKLQKPLGYVDNLTREKLNELLTKSRGKGSGEIIWEIGKIAPGTGIFESPPIAAFQIAFTPELSKKGQIATLIEDVTLTAKDLWTGNYIQATDEAITTLLPDEPAELSGEGRVR